MQDFLVDINRALAVKTEKIKIEKRKSAMLAAWMKNILTNKSEWQFLNGKNKVIIYGGTDLGYLCYLVLQCRLDNIIIVDRNISEYGNYETARLMPLKEMPTIQDKSVPVIITVLEYFDNIKQKMFAMGFFHVLSLEECIRGESCDR